LESVRPFVTEQELERTKANCADFKNDPAVKKLQVFCPEGSFFKKGWARVSA
jgi:hypothetical protein